MDILTFRTMEARANFIGATGMARLIGDIWDACWLIRTSRPSTCA